MTLKLYSVRTMAVLIGLSTLLVTQTQSLVGQQIPASELPPSGTDTGLEGKYDPQNGIAQLIRDKSSESAASKIFEDGNKSGGHIYTYDIWMRQRRIVIG